MRQPKVVSLSRWLGYCASLLLFGSLTVGFSPNDSKETNLRVMGDAGQYADIRRGCDGSVIEKHEVPIRELSASLSHKASNSVHVGVDGSFIYSNKKEYRFDPEQNRSLGRYAPHQLTALHPYIGVEGKHIGVGAGYLWASDYLPSADRMDMDLRSSPTGFLRIGNPQSVYVDASYFHAVPLSPGYIRFGIGSNHHPRTDWWFGLGIGPYDGLGVALRTETQIRPELDLNVLVRVGSSEGLAEGVVGLGATYRLSGRRAEDDF
jgi:hypothetical protein